MGEKRQKFLLKRFYYLYAAVALLIYGALMLFVFPWWNASEHVVELSLGMDSPDKVELGYSAGERVKFHPVGSVDGYHWNWRAELPLRPGYEFALIFPDGSDGDIIFKAIRIKKASSESEVGMLTALLLRDVPDDQVQLQVSGVGTRIQAPPGGRLELPVAMMAPRPIDWMKDWAKATLGYIVVSLILLFTLTTFFRFPHGLQSYRRRAPAAEILIVLLAALLGTLAHLHLLRYSMPLLTPGQSDALLLKAVSFDKAMEVEMGKVAGIPGPTYPWLVAQVAPSADWNMSQVTLGQGILFCFALILLALSLVRLIQGYYLAPVLLVAMLSPPALWASRHIGVQSVLTSSWLISLAVFIFLMHREGVMRWLGFALFGLLSVAAVSIAPQSLLLLFLPFGLLTGTFWWSLSIKGSEFWKLPIFWTTFAQTMLPALMVLVSAVVLCQQGCNTRVVETNDQHQQITPMQGRFADWGRLSGRGLFLPRMDGYVEDASNTDYKVRFGFRSGAHAAATRASLSEIMRLTGQPVFIAEKRSNRQVVSYNHTIVSIYSWFYRILFFAAIGGWMIGLAERKYLAAILVLPFLLNVLMHVYLRDLVNYDIQVFDACLWFSALAGLLVVNPKALQKPTDESDRRCMAPIRPKRLLTRFTKVRKMPF